MIQIYHKYTEWEDFKNGMFETKFKNESTLIKKASELLSNEKEFYKISIKVLENWKISTDVNLSNKNSNRQSWIGQAACCYAYKVPELLTRKAWNGLDQLTKVKANLIADKIILLYERKYFELHKDVGKTLLF